MTERVVLRLNVFGVVQRVEIEIPVVPGPPYCTRESRIMEEVKNNISYMEDCHGDAK